MGLGGRDDFFFENTDELVYDVPDIISESSRSLRKLITLKSGQDPFET